MKALCDILAIGGVALLVWAAWGVDHRLGKAALGVILFLVAASWAIKGRKHGG